MRIARTTQGWLTSLLITTAVGCSTASAEQAAEQPKPITVAATAVERAAVADSYRASGTLRGRNTATLTSKVVGYVKDVRVKAGDDVTAGQLLATIEADSVLAQARLARAALKEARHAKKSAGSAVQAAQAGAKVADATHRRIASLHDQGVTTLQQREESDAHSRQARAENDMAETALLAATARIEQARAKADQAKAMLDDTKIRAPFSGRVIERRVEPGNLAAPGGPLLVVEERGPLRVDVGIDESKVGRIKLGDTAEVEIEALGRRVSGRVSEIAPAVDVATRSFLVKVELDRDSSQGDLQPGMFARVRFGLAALPRLVVPRDAVSARGQLDRVFVIEQQRAQLRLVTLGARHEDVVEVLTGLEPGEQIVAQPPVGLTSGQPVAVQ